MATAVFKKRAIPIIMTSAPNSVGTLLRIRSFGRETRGQAAIEFAVILPLMLTSLLGGVEIGDGIAISRKTEIVARTVADLASQYNNPNMNNVLWAHRPRSLRLIRRPTWVSQYPG